MIRLLVLVLVFATLHPVPVEARSRASLERRAVPTVVRNVFVFESESGTRVGPYDVHLAGGSILRLAAPAEILGVDGARQVDGTGLTLLPGLVECHAHVLGDDFEPVIQSRFDVVVSGLGEGNFVETVSLRPDRSHPGLYEGYFTPPASGRYRIESNETDQHISNTTEFQVTVVKKELIDPNVRVERLERIANLTGGTCLNMSEFSKIQSLVNNKPLTTTVRSERPLWDNGLMAFVIIGLVGLEWIVRRRNDLP